jgi:hypothetical protein
VLSPSASAILHWCSCNCSKWYARTRPQRMPEQLPWWTSPQ